MGTKRNVRKPWHSPPTPLRPDRQFTPVASWQVTPEVLRLCESRTLYAMLAEEAYARLLDTRPVLDDAYRTSSPRAYRDAMARYDEARDEYYRARREESRADAAVHRAIYERETSAS